MEEKEQYFVEGPCVDPTIELQKEIEELKFKVEQLEEDRNRYYKLYNEYLESTVKYRCAFKALLEEIKK